MVKLKLTLKSKKPSNVYALNGKSYRLQPGSNTLTLEYNDYLSLAKALGIKPVENPDTPKSTPKEEVIESKPETPKQETVKEPAPLDDPKPVEDTPAEEADKQPIDEDPESVDDSVDDNESDEDSKGADYTSWSYSKLKAEYKRITGNNCKLKKSDVIRFLQEHN